jgi:putative heme iron utilization protein
MAEADDRTQQGGQDHEAPGGSAPRVSPIGVDVSPAPSHAERVRTLAGTGGKGTLSTLATEPAGHPFGSVVAYVVDGSGHPVFVASRLAEHTRNFQADPRASLFVQQTPPEGVDPLSLERATLLGSVSPAERLRGPYLAAHPYAELYVDFKDMAFYRLTVEAIRYVGGFGRMSWVETTDYLEAEPDPVSGAAATEIVDHMNHNHSAALVEYCSGIYGLAGVRAARMTAVDRYGFEVLTDEHEGSRPVRFGFAHPARSPEDVQQELVALLRRARGQTGVRPGGQQEEGGAAQPAEATKTIPTTH